MPELPEVETIVSELDQKVKGRKISDLEILEPKMLYGDPRLIKGLEIERIRRRAKLIIFDLSSNFHLIIHLKLTGQLIVKEKNEENKGLDELGPTRIIIRFTDGSQINFNDLRKFGWLKIVDEKQLSDILKKENYGPEPLEKDFTLEKFTSLLAQREKAQIKPLLMDQTFIAGIGNLYSDEILFYAGIHPKRRVGELTNAEIKKIHEGIKKILTEALKYKGSSLDTYRRTTGEKGTYEFHRKVYRRAGQKCLRCGSVIKSIKMGGRTACFCPNCQK